MRKKNKTPITVPPPFCFFLGGGGGGGFFLRGGGWGLSLRTLDGIEPFFCWGGGVGVWVGGPLKKTKKRLVF